ncbi:MAG TPA: hypothetical protein PKY59_13550 [Pyrinomonadaceae bacterium]|nr:hypothetical protein [Pyrinomonadaceae bacterium]
MSISTQTEQRQSRRFPLAFKLTVKAKEDTESFWKETTDVLTIARNGAGFYLPRKVQVGQLLSLLMPMPKHLRGYDDDKEFYRIWGLVQHCNPISGDEAQGFHVGVAFIGKNAPESYHQAPQQSYMICGMSEDGFWKIKETATPFVTRKHTRYWTSIDVRLEVIDIDGNVVTHDTTKTENLSYSGAAVFSYMDANVGECCRVFADEYEFMAIAVVRNRKLGKDKLPRLHLEFVDEQFPIEKLGSNLEETEEN